MHSCIFKLGPGSKEVKVLDPFFQPLITRISPEAFAAAPSQRFMEFVFLPRLSPKHPRKFKVRN